MTPRQGSPKLTQTDGPGSQTVMVLWLKSVVVTRKIRPPDWRPEGDRICGQSGSRRLVVELRFQYVRPRLAERAEDRHVVARRVAGDHLGLGAG